MNNGNAENVDKEKKLNLFFGALGIALGFILGATLMSYLDVKDDEFVDGLIEKCKEIAKTKRLLSREFHNLDNKRFQLELDLGACRAELTHKKKRAANDSIEFKSCPIKSAQEGCPSGGALSQPKKLLVEE